MGGKTGDRQGGAGNLAEATPHYLGHRARLRQRFREAALKRFPTTSFWKWCCTAHSRAVTPSHSPRI
jgi:hypothetical protein